MRLLCEMQSHIGVRGTPRDKATIEHLDHRPPFRWKHGLRAKGIVICCASCNASRGAKTHDAWFRSAYCIDLGISAITVAEPVRTFLAMRVSDTETPSSTEPPPTPLGFEP